MLAWWEKWVGILPCPPESNPFFDGRRPAPWDRILASIGASPPSSLRSNPSRQLWQPVLIALAMRPLLALVFPPALVASTYPCTDTTLAFQMDVTPRAPIVARPRRGVLFESYPCAEKPLFLFFEPSTCWDWTNYPRRRCAGVRRACGSQRLTWVWKRLNERDLRL